MSQSDVDRLEQRVKELEQELAERERDLAVYREELRKANGQLEKFIQQISQELRVANMIQKILVPTEFPNIPGFEFSTKFKPSSISGGDYFDIFEHEDRFRFGIVLANSTGYSMSALFLSILLKMTGQMEARRGAAPERILETMAQELIPHIQSADQANVIYCVVDRRSFDFSYACVGRVIGLMFNYSEDKLRRLETHHPAFSRDFKGPITGQKISLNPRDRVILCSEGVLRVTNPKGELFGEERLYKTVLAAPRLGVHEMRNEILFQLEKFAAGQEFPQDVTVIVTEVKDRVIKLAKNVES